MTIKYNYNDKKNNDNKIDKQNHIKTIIKYINGWVGSDPYYMGHGSTYDPYKILIGL